MSKTTIHPPMLAYRVNCSSDDALALVVALRDRGYTADRVDGLFDIYIFVAIPPSADASVANITRAIHTAIADSEARERNATLESWDSRIDVKAIMQAGRI